MKLDGRRVVVTGGGSGIGAAVALDLARDGCRVVVSGRNLEKLEKVARQSPVADGVVPVEADISQEADVRRLFERAEQELGGVDILVNSAGINIPRRALSELSIIDWNAVMQTNATGAFLCIHAVLPQMRRRRDGLIINVSSVAGLRASLLGGAAYTASKFAMSGLGMVVGLEEKDNGIRVTNIYPGEVETPILDQRPTPVTAEHRARILQPEDVSAAVLMVARLPPRAHIPELVIKPTTQAYA